MSIKSFGVKLMFDISIELSTRKKQSEKVKNNIIVFIVAITIVESYLLLVAV